MIDGFEVLTANIANGQSLSQPINISRVRHLMKLHMPAAFTGSELTFSVSRDGEVWRDLYTPGGPSTAVNVSVTTTEGGGGGSSASAENEDEHELSIKVGASRSIPISGMYLAGEAFLKVRSGKAGAPTAQGAARAIELIAVVEPEPVEPD